VTVACTCVLLQRRRAWTNWRHIYSADEWVGWERRH